MATTTDIDIEKELIGLEDEFWRALRDGDVASAVGMTDFPCILTGAQGVTSVDEATLSSMMKNASYKLDSYELAPGAKIRLVGHDTAVVAYRVHEELTVDGKPVHLDAAESSTWILRDGKWRCAQHTEAILGDPFGRDRSGAAR